LRLFFHASGDSHTFDELDLAPLLVVELTLSRRVAVREARRFSKILRAEGELLARRPAKFAGMSGARNAVAREGGGDCAVAAAASRGLAAVVIIADLRRGRGLLAPPLLKPANAAASGVRRGLLSRLRDLGRSSSDRERPPVVAVAVAAAAAARAPTSLPTLFLDFRLHMAPQVAVSASQHNLPAALSAAGIADFVLALRPMPPGYFLPNPSSSRSCSESAGLLPDPLLGVIAVTDFLRSLAALYAMIDDLLLSARSLVRSFCCSFFFFFRFSR